MDIETVKKNPVWVASVVAILVAFLSFFLPMYSICALGNCQSISNWEDWSAPSVDYASSNRSITFIAIFFVVAILAASGFGAYKMMTKDKMYSNKVLMILNIVLSLLFGLFTITRFNTVNRQFGAYNDESVSFSSGIAIYVFVLAILVLVGVNGFFVAKSFMKK